MASWPAGATAPPGRPPARLPDLRTARLPDLRTARLPDLRTARLPDLRTARLPDLRTAQFPELRAAQFPEYGSVTVLRAAQRRPAGPVTFRWRPCGRPPPA